ncbi:MAG TPA: hypothetical protein PLB25_17580 [Rhodoferax sp.]|nr:hypothetical protein [Rhodoferax sp.]
MNRYFASAMFDKPIRYVARPVRPAVLARFFGTLAISWIPVLSADLPQVLVNPGRPAVGHLAMLHLI